MIPIWPHCVFLSTQELVSEQRRQRGRFLLFFVIQCGRVTGEPEPWWDGMIRFCLSLVSRVFLSSRVLKTPWLDSGRPADVTSWRNKKKKKGEGGEEESHVGAHMHTITYVGKERPRWLKESKRHFGWRNNVCRRRVTWRGLWGNVFALLSFLFSACDERKTIKSEFWEGPSWRSSREETETPPPVS